MENKFYNEITTHAHKKGLLSGSNPGAGVQSGGGIPLS
jgi:hypothetical protein